MRGIFDGRRRSPSDGEPDDHGDGARGSVDRPVYAIVVLIDDVETARDVAAQLGRARARQAASHDSGNVVIVVPPHRGVDFFGDADVQAQLDIWWRGAVPGHALPLYVANHHADLGSWLEAVDGHFYVATPDASATRSYADCANVTAIMGAGSAELVAAVARRCGLKGFEGLLPITKKVTRETVRSVSGPAGFRRASLRAADEFGGDQTQRLELTVVKEPAGSEGFFRATDEPLVAAGTEQHATQELISVLGDALRRLQGMSAVAPGPDSAAG